MIEGNCGEVDCVASSNRTRGTKKMPLLFYFPLIVWIGMMNIMHEETQQPVKVKAHIPTQH